MDRTTVDIDCVKIAARLRLTGVDMSEASSTCGLGARGQLVMPPGSSLRIQPFAASERLMGNRHMTTTVIVHPHPAAGLKVKVDLVSPIDGGVNSTEFLKAGDPQKTYHAHDGMAVNVAEVPDEPMVEVEGDTLPGEQIHDPTT